MYLVKFGVLLLAERKSRLNYYLVRRTHIHTVSLKNER